MDNSGEIKQALEGNETALVEDEETEHPNDVGLNAEEVAEDEADDCRVPFILEVDAEEECDDGEAKREGVETD